MDNKIQEQLNKESLHISLVELASKLCKCQQTDIINLNNEELENIIKEKLS